MPAPTLWTIGHSNRPLSDFLSLLRAEQVETVADVRRFPGSRLHPHFNREALAASLHEAGVDYVHFPALGGRRTLHGPSAHNSGWRIAAFAAYADYMLSDEFAGAFEELTALAARSRTAITCAEALPWRCHRRLIADQFVAHGWTVRDIIGPGQLRQHTLPPFATVVNGQVTYPG